MSKRATAREFLYTTSTNDPTNTNVDGEENRHPVIRRAFKLLNKDTIIPIKMRSKKTDITIPPITAGHKQTPVGHPEIGHIQAALKTRAKLMQHW
jgi:hypothetical protein